MSVRHRAARSVDRVLVPLHWDIPPTQHSRINCLQCLGACKWFSALKVLSIACQFQVLYAKKGDTSKGWPAPKHNSLRFRDHMQLKSVFNIIWKEYPGFSLFWLDDFAQLGGQRTQLCSLVMCIMPHRALAFILMSIVWPGLVKI